MGSALIISLRKRRIRCPTRSKHRLYVPFVRQNAGGFRKAPSTFEGGALRRAVPAPLSGPGGLHCRRQCPGERPYTSAPLSFGLCPLPCPARGEAIHISAPLSLGSARCLFRPIFLCCSRYHAPGLFPCLFIFSLAGPARRRSPARFLLAKKGRFPVPLCAVV